MNRIAEIIDSGVAPGFANGALDPTSADAAIPRALKQLEQTKDARSIVKEMGWKPTKKNLNAIKAAWSM